PQVRLIVPAAHEEEDVGEAAPGAAERHAAGRAADGDDVLAEGGGQRPTGMQDGDAIREGRTGNFLPGADGVQDRLRVVYLPGLLGQPDHVAEDRVLGA